MSDGQAGEHESGNVAESATFLFSSSEDFIDRSKEIIENAKDGFISKMNYVSESYKRGQFEIVMELSSGLFPGYYHLIFTAIPGGWSPERKIEGNSSLLGSFNEKRRRIELDASGTEWCKHGVLIDVPKFIQGPQGLAFASLVRLECAKQRSDITWNVLGHSVSPILPVFRFSSERENGPFGIRNAGSDSGPVCDLVKDRSKVVEGISGDIWELVWERLNKLDLMELCNSVVIQFDGPNVRVAINKSDASGFKVNGVFLCAC